ncbi:probable E3 ubiquitin-protein ligase MARCHF10 isoform X2 [Rana temporaria]|uniref:probable E3 ubiquitin-protein ligase MARCHF10 isoform X2 n=1 Tax=Rana temporaria TaxID=8407 RepID=UPI001AAD7530|nr:probable E3 ubiquitin-protein ligase MARCHF10 isoform X2 [Rana temporaria]
MVDRKWDRGKSIVNGQHMRATRYQMDTEYQVYLRHQEQEREKAEYVREKQAALKPGSQHGRSIYSARSYNKPWQTGMTTKEQIPGRLGDENGHMKHQYTSAVCKLPSIKKDKEPIRKKAVLRSSTVNKTQNSNTVSQPPITVEKKRVHARQPSSKSNVTHFNNATGRREWQKKIKEPRKQEIKKHRFTEQEKENTTVNQSPCLEQNTRSHNNQHDQVSATTSAPLLDDLQTISEPMNFRQSPIYTSDDSFNRIPEINTEDDIENGESSNNDEHDDIVYLSESVSSVPLPLGPQSYGTPLTDHSNWRNHVLELDEEASSDSETEEFPVIRRLNHDFNAETTINRLDITTSSVRNPNNLPPLTSPRSLGLRMTLQHVDDSSQNNAPVSFLNLRDIELRRIGVAIAPQTQEHTRQSHVAETALPQLHDINSNTRNVQNHEYHSNPQTTFRTEERRNGTTSSSEVSSRLHVATLRPSLSSTAPTFTLLHENLDLIAQTISMRRQSERIINMTPEKENVKPKPDPEKLKKIQESLLEEDSEDEGDLCRICFTGDTTPENQLVAPCRCKGSLMYVHKECMNKWLLSKIESGAALSAVKTCEMCKQNMEHNFEEFDVDEHYRRHQETQATLNPSLYLVLLLNLYQQRYEDLLRLSNTRDRISRRFSNLSLHRRENSGEDNQDT